MPNADYRHLKTLNKIKDEMKFIWIVFRRPPEKTKSTKKNAEEQRICCMRRSYGNVIPILMLVFFCLFVCYFKRDRKRLIVIIFGCDESNKMRQEIQ